MPNRIGRRFVINGDDDDDGIVRDKGNNNDNRSKKNNKVVHHLLSICWLAHIHKTSPTFPLFVIERYLFRPKRANSKKIR